MSWLNWQLFDVVGFFGIYWGLVLQYLFGMVMISALVRYGLDALLGEPNTNGYKLYPYDGWAAMPVFWRGVYLSSVILTPVFAPLWFSAVALVLFLLPWIAFCCLLALLLFVTFMFIGADSICEWRKERKAKKAKQAVENTEFDPA